MAENKPINWAYPFPCKETNSNSLQLLTHMAKARGGYYPTGENGLWHGGVHFDDGTAAVFDQSSVRCIADGEVIAYRIDERYPVSEFTDEIPRIKRAPFSTGFVLVKHTLQPPQPKKAEGDAADEQMPPSLTLYSLYMHLQDWAGYQAKADLPRPAFWEVKSHIVNTQSGGLGVRANPDVNSPRLSELSKGAEITVSAAEGEFVKLASLINGTANPPLTADSEGNLPGYISSKFLQARSEPKELGQVVVLDAGIPIKAGELIGHPGTYQNHNSSAHPLVHLEVFSCDDVPGFIAQSRAWANRLPDEQKTLLKVYKGASKLIAHRDDINANNPPKLSDSGSQIGVDLIVPQALLDGLPAANKIQVKTLVEGSPTPNTTYWWRLEGLFADENGNPIDGWLAEQELITTRHSPWEWQDFQWLEDTGTPLEKLAYTFNARGMLSEDEQHNYRAQISKGDGGPIVTLARLYDIVDTDKDGVLTSDEIRAALVKPWHAQVFGQLITKYESEWFWNKGKWDELDPLLAEELGKPNPIWEVEKQRIEELSWWKELAGRHGISGDGKAWHFQALGLVGGLRALEDENDLKWLQVPHGQLTFDVEGNDIEDSRFFSRVPHWPPVGASGVTIGRGYDVGHQPNVRDDLESVGISEPLLSWLSGGKGLTKNNARDYLNAASAEIRSAQITRKQQHELFIFVYEFMERDVRRICEKRDVIEVYGVTNWDALHSKIKDMLVDLRYRGDYTPNIRALLQEYVANNDLARFSEVIKTRSNWPESLPSDRFLRRSRYLDE
ncbi:hypothetical protein EA796_17420 [Pseudomonas sp. AOB-7]|uniref:pesticin C-terminus-like muramidase n=1 Tax=Pseudomonas sp. AOB-7 TaxID=2482750 RepID=UPI000EFB6EE7|nr:pesticin C-terminus-like muramidase [Pseudomonas sp. AOB-7]RMH83312.1 hypothetical protein EA796_17420 [Pseudomonas sp. AOB-7]